MTQYLSDREQLIALWREAFGDSREDVEAFLKNLFSKENYFCKKIGQSVVSQTFTLPVRLYSAEKVFKGWYFCCAATDKACRGKGYMGELITLVKQTADKKGLDFVALIPASRSLFGFYSRFGFEEFFFCDSVGVSGKKASVNVAGKHFDFVKTNDADELLKLQNAAITANGQTDGTVVKSKEIFSYLIDDAGLSGYDIYTVRRGKESLGYIFYDPKEGLVREALLKEDRADVLADFAEEIARKDITVRSKARGFENPKGMIYTTNPLVKRLKTDFPFINNMLES